jgi:hypothetical protein
MRVPLMHDLLRVVVLGAILLFSRPLAAGWWDIWVADGSLDLESAREIALTGIAEDPESSDAVAAATWWLANINNLPLPEEVLTVVEGDRDPELGFVLARIESTLNGRPPAGALKTGELSGPYGVFSILDLERPVVPPDGQLPEPETRWLGSTPFRLQMKPPDGRHGPPMAMAVDGVYLVAWNLQVDRDVVGWLVIEADGGFNFEVDGRQVARHRYCGRVDPGTTWYRTQLAAGSHRLRIEIASPDLARVRVSLIDDRGTPLGGVTVVENDAAPHSASATAPAMPPAFAALSEILTLSNVSEADLMQAAFLARGRGDPQNEHQWLDRARDNHPESPWPALGLAHHLYVAGVGSGNGEPDRRVAELLQAGSAIAKARLLGRALAARENRREDAERILEELMVDHSDDVRVLRIWVREAVRRGWAREAEESLARLEMELPGSRGVIGLRLEVLAELERWRERGLLLRSLGGTDPAERRWIGQLSSSCMVSEAVTATESLLEEVDDPDFDAQLIRLHFENGDLESAAKELARARDAWGDLPVFDEMELVLNGGDDDALDKALLDALERDPSNLQLLTLAWRRGAEPFFEPFRVEARDFANKHRDLGTDADVVLLLDQAVERIFADGSSLYYYHGLSRANTPVGARRASFLQPLPDSYLLKVRILKPDGSVIVPSELQAANGGIGLNEVKPGDLVEEEYVARVAATGASRNGHLPPYIYRFADPDRAFGLSEYVLLVPQEVDLQVDGKFDGLERSEQEWRGQRLLRWGAERVPPMPTEPFAPPAQDLIPWLNYGFGVSWQDVGDAVRDRVLPVLRTSPELREWSAPFLGDANVEDVVRNLVDSLLDTVEAAGGELAVGAAAGDSFARRRGNRLGIVAAVLAEAGWKVDLVLTRPWTQRGNRLDVPTLDAFPAAVLRVERDGHDVWIDIREERRGVNHINPLFQGSDGLVLPLSQPEEPVSLLAQLPSFGNPELEEAVRVRAVVAANGDAMINFRMALRGAQAERLLERVESAPEEQVSMVYRQMAVSLFPGADSVEGEIDRGEGESEVELEMTVRNACEEEGGGLVCRTLVLANPLVPVLASLAERAYPLVLRVPLLRRLELEVVPPSGWRQAERQPRRLEARWGSVDETLDQTAEFQSSVLNVVLPAQTISPEDYPEFARFCQAVDELSTRPPRLVPATTAP